MHRNYFNRIKKAVIINLLTAVFAIGLNATDTSALMNKYVGQANDAYDKGDLDTAYKAINAALMMSKSSTKQNPQLIPTAQFIYKEKLNMLRHEYDNDLFVEIKNYLEQFPAIENTSIKKLKEQVIAIQEEKKKAKRFDFDKTITEIYCFHAETYEIMSISFCYSNKAEAFYFCRTGDGVRYYLSDEDVQVICRGINKFTEWVEIAEKNDVSTVKEIEDTVYKFAKNTVRIYAILGKKEESNLMIALIEPKLFPFLMSYSQAQEFNKVIEINNLNKIKEEIQEEIEKRIQEQKRIDDLFK